MEAWNYKRSARLILSTAVLTLLLATLQYYWVGQVSQGERERMQASLRTEAAHFSEAFDHELARAYLTFQLDGQTLADRDWNSFAWRYAQWRATAPFPDLIKDVYLAEVSETGYVRLSRYSSVRGRFDRVAWPNELTPLRRRYERLYPSDPKTLPANDAAPRPVMPGIPALDIPVSNQVVLSDAQKNTLNVNILMAEGFLPRAWRRCTDCKGVGYESVAAHTIVVLDGDELRRHVIPALARQHFAGGGSFDYHLTIVSREDPAQVIYRSDNDAGEGAGPSDATIELFSVRFDELNQLLLENSLLQQRGADGDPQRVRIGILGASSDPGGGQGAWQARLSHRAGSLEAFVESLRRRNLLISFGILLMLAISVLLTIVSTQRAQRLAEQKLEFAAAISHELRTPLAVICSAGENLADGVLRDMEHVRQYGALIRSEGRRLAEMVEQALEFAGVHSSHQSYTLRPVAPGELVEGALAAFQPHLYAGGFRVDLDIAPGLPPVLADAPALRRAIHNLLGNAVKYSAEERWIGVRVAADAGEGERGPEVQITVRDRGLGILPDDLAHVFEPFYRGRNVTAAHIHGSGLGLSLVQHVVAAHAGQVCVESTLGQGSAFTLRLPAAPVEQPEPTCGAPDEGAYEQAHIAG